MTLIQHQPVMTPRFTGLFSRSDRKADAAQSTTGANMTPAPKPLEITARIVAKTTYYDYDQFDHSKRWNYRYWITLALDAAQAVHFNVNTQQEFKISLNTYNKLHEDAMVSVILVPKRKLFGGIKYKVVFNEFKGKIGEHDEKQA